MSGFRCCCAMSKTCYMNVALTCVMKRSVFGGIGLTDFCLKIRKDRINCTRSYSNWQWYLNESFVKINGETHYRWRAVDHEGEVLESIVTKRHDRRAALKFLKKTMKSYGNPYVIATVCLKSSGVAMKVIGNARRQMTGRRLNNRAENSYLPFRRRERAILRFRQSRCVQKFVSIHTSVHNHFYHERHLNSQTTFKLKRTAALAEWRQLCAA